MQQYLLDVVNDPWYEEHARGILGLSMLAKIAALALVVVYQKKRTERQN